jgi:hypothetical protein
MRLPRQVGGFFLRLLLVYGFFSVPWPGVEAGYATLFRGGGNLILREFGSRGLVHFQPLQPPERWWDTEMRLSIRNQAGSKGVRFSSRYGGYMPTAVVVAFILSTSLPWARRLWALLWGVVLVNLFVLGRVVLLLLFAFRGDPHGGLYVLSPGVAKALAVTVDFVSVSPVISCVVPAIIWMLVAFRRGDWSTIFREIGRLESSGATPARARKRQ